MARQVSQSCGHSGPHRSTRLGTPRAELVGHPPRLADVLVRALSGGEHDESGAQALEHGAVLVQAGQEVQR